MYRKDTENNTLSFGESDPAIANLNICYICFSFFQKYNITDTMQFLVFSLSDSIFFSSFLPRKNHYPEFGV